MKQKLIFLGYGNMAKAILCDNEFIAKNYILSLAGRSESKIKQLAQQLQNAQIIESSYTDSSIDVSNADIVLCVKPKGLSEFRFIGEARRVYSVLAGISVSEIQSHIKAKCFIRMMPNIAAAFKQSATCVYIHNELNQESIQEILDFIQSFGIAVLVDKENLINTSIGTSGSSQAFLAVVAEGLIESGIFGGLNYEQSLKLVAQSFEGFASALKHKSPNEIKYAISSPGGTTIAGLATLEKAGVKGSIMQAAIASINKANGI